MGVLFFIFGVVFMVLWGVAVNENLNKKQTIENLKKSHATELEEKKEQIKKLNIQIEKDTESHAAELEEKKEQIKELDEQLRNNREVLIRKQDQIEALSKYQDIVDIRAEVERSKREAQSILDDANSQSKEIISAAKQEAKDTRAKAKSSLEAAEKTVDLKLDAASDEAKRILRDAEDRAKEMAGEAYEIAGKVQELRKTAAAMKNLVDGYGDQYLKPTYSLIDDLAEEFGFAEAGQKLKQARENSARMVEKRTAAVCDYNDHYRRNIAINFVVDAFNGKVDSILSKTKKDNYGILEQKIKDAYQLVNHNGRAFRNAVITPEYLSARLEELKWAVIASELKAQAQEEQRKLREQIREEERARREYEKAMKDAAKEEEMLRKAMEKAQKQIETASEAKRAEYEAKLDELRQKLQEAEERGQRALSMAQQTKHGNVYVISNVGSFGENVYKVGMTRRLDPMDRVKELGDASVPFPFDVHAIIESDDAPGLENTLHKELALTQMNKVNPRKEFFKIGISEIKAMVEKLGLQTAWTLEAQAAEYRETLAIEERMRLDPDAKRKWEEFAQKISSENSVLEKDE